MKVREISYQLSLAYLFFLGSLLGYILEVFYRRFTPNNKERKWINPGFCIGPYLPIYGIALCVLRSLAYLAENSGMDDTVIGMLEMFGIMAICITIIEYFAGVICVKVFNVRLWDYRKEFLNLQGHICLKFTIYWWLLSAFYYFVIDNHVVAALTWLKDNLSFSFVIGYFFGVFSIDIIYSSNLLMKMREFAMNNQITVGYEKLVSYAKDKWMEKHNKNKISMERIKAYDVIDEIKEITDNMKDRFQ
ncbi:MAG: putative ABC transporter permease [Lachnospiraceae bacterium]|nr:putative ABC transporter permease [Lachnospiraceae bacterium]